MPKTYYNKLYVQICVWDQNNVARVTSEANNVVKRLDLRKTGCKHWVLALSEFSKLVGAPNEFLSLIIIYYKV